MIPLCYWALEDSKVYRDSCWIMIFCCHLHKLRTSYGFLTAVGGAYNRLGAQPLPLPKFRSKGGPYGAREQNKSQPPKSQTIAPPIGYDDCWFHLTIPWGTIEKFDLENMRVAEEILFLPSPDPEIRYTWTPASISHGINVFK